jgi:hypothetical protein
VAKDYMATINIGAGGSKKLQYKIDVANSILRYVLYFFWYATKLVGKTNAVRFSTGGNL